MNMGRLDIIYVRNFNHYRPQPKWLWLIRLIPFLIRILLIIVHRFLVASIDRHLSLPKLFDINEFKFIYIFVFITHTRTHTFQLARRPTGLAYFDCHSRGCSLYLYSSHKRHIPPKGYTHLNFQLVLKSIPPLIFFNSFYLQFMARIPAKPFRSIEVEVDDRLTIGMTIILYLSPNLLSFSALSLLLLLLLLLLVFGHCVRVLKVLVSVFSFFFRSMYSACF